MHTAVSVLCVVLDCCWHEMKSFIPSIFGVESPVAFDIAAAVAIGVGVFVLTTALVRRGLDICDRRRSKAKPEFERTLRRRWHRSPRESSSSESDSSSDDEPRPSELHEREGVPIVAEPKDAVECCPCGNMGHLISAANCNHIGCHECWAEHIGQWLASGRSGAVPCMWPGCNEVLDVDAVNARLDAVVSDGTDDDDDALSHSRSPQNGKGTTVPTLPAGSTLRHRRKHAAM